jgi:cell division protein FtsQ
VSGGASTAAGRSRVAGRAQPAPRRARPAPAKRKPAHAKRKPASRPAVASGRGWALPSLPSISIPRPSFGWLGTLSSRRGLLVAALVIVAMAAGYYGWFRNSSLVSVEHVKVEGVSTSDHQLVGALTDAAQGMSSLNVDTPKLQAIAAQFPTVESIGADGSFPHGLTIHVTERLPAMIASDGKGEVPVAADGTILPGVDLGSAANKLPTLNVTHLHESGRLGGDPLQKALILGAAPEPLRPLIDGIGIEPQTGITVTLQGGFKVEFGPSTDAAEKWNAAAAVLADPKLHSLTYVDVRIPGRPAVGGAPPLDPAASDTSATP